MKMSTYKKTFKYQLINAMMEQEALFEKYEGKKWDSENGTRQVTTQRGEIVHSILIVLDDLYNGYYKDRTNLEVAEILEKAKNNDL